MHHPVITFPPPPPTHNTLTNEQRAQLMRTSNKLGQVLGSTPHIIDFSYTAPPLRVDLTVRRPRTPAKPTRAFFKRKAAPGPDLDLDLDSDSENTSLASPVSARSAPSPRASTSSRRTISSPVPSLPDKSELRWRTRYPACRPPMLTVAHNRARPVLAAIPGAPPGIEDLCAPAGEDVPQFTIPSEAAMRREKMRRLRRRLGEGVPVHLVFPPGTSDEDEDEDGDDADVGEKDPRVGESGWEKVDLPVFGKPPPYTTACRLPTIMETSSEGPCYRHEARRRSQFVGTAETWQARRSAIYVEDGGERALEDGIRCLAVSVVAGTDEKFGDVWDSGGMATEAAC